MASFKENLIREAIEATGVNVLDIWHVGLIGWKCQVEYFEKGNRFMHEINLGYDIDTVLENIENNTTDPPFTNYNEHTNTFI